MHWLDPDYLPKTAGTLDRFLLNPKADIDGLLLTDGTEIHTPPHLSSQLLTALAPGAKFTVRGVKPRECDVIVAVAIDPAQGERIVDNGPDPKHDKHDKHNKHDKQHKHAHAPKHGQSAMHGVIRQLLHGPKGNVHGALLDDGVVVRFPKHSIEMIADLLVIDAPLSVRGMSLTTAQGTVIDAEALGKNASELVELGKPHDHEPKKPGKKPEHKHREHHHH